MKGSIRLVKRGVTSASRDLELKQNPKTNSRQSNREIASTVKGWIAELEQRQRRDERASMALIK